MRSDVTENKKSTLSGEKEGLVSRTYLCMDLKSFYASVECADRDLDPLTTNLVVADPSRTEKTICLAVSPSLKAYGISGRARLFEVIEQVRRANVMRKKSAPGGRFTGSSIQAPELAAHPEYQIDYLIAPPRMAQLMEALDADWEGYDEMRADFASQPKYGNNIPEVDVFVADMYKLHADTCLSLPCVYGDSLKPNAISISAHQPGGAVTGATPDGRKGGEILADASLSPAHGTDTHGPIAVFQSAMRVNQDPYQGTLMNMKFHPSALKTESDLEKLGIMIQTYLTHGGKHIQFNVVNKEEMVDAKDHPEDHPELIVRVAGYSAYFTRLTPGIQDEVINRMDHDL